MDPLKVAARFAAFVWFTHQSGNADKSREEALQFAHENWVAFLPWAHEGLGKLIIRVTAARPGKRRRSVRRVQTLT